ncbi:hypothetical protein L485_11120 [Sphingobium baderi LL03]|uniref:Uncharacterized protein n=2 Tax=Sphingobium baderi TaxID=1332080 RepID=T0GL50_9SPHN|nr:6-hydroxymethylpterin diphosphokinase MptE-like protein [Sphingobium baderi]EQB01417.1 hypothetical protein L485_11120 [Sphingobium baderi LL03]WRD76222.1 DUF115 domain-containing protein [Sphingobium baderi]
MFPSYDDPIEKRIKRFNFDPALANKIKSTKRCFVLGMGPSLEKIDPAGLGDEFVIGTNFILRTDFKPDVICVVDNRRFDYENWSKSDVKVITVKQISERRGEQMNDINHYADVDYIDYNTGLQTSVLKISDFDNRFATVNFSGSVITDLVIPFACYLGMKEIYVLGLDGAVASFPSTHITGHEANYQAALPSRLFHLHEKSAQLAARRNVKVFNASPGGVVAALEKVSLERVKPNAVRKAYDGVVDGRFIVIDGHITKVEAVDGGYRIVHERSRKVIRHKNGRVIFDIDDGSAAFKADSTFSVEPSFVRRDWVCFLSTNAKGRYITALDELGGYRLKPYAEIFSAYFSSFKLFEDWDSAVERAEHMKALKNLDKIRQSIGTAMVADDKR